MEPRAEARDSSQAASLEAREYADARRVLLALHRGPEADVRRFLVSWAATVAPLPAVLTLCVLYPGVPSLLLAVLVTGFVQNGLGLLMHEGCHYFFHRDHRLNDRLADALVCLPIFNTVEGYRRPHFDHHRLSGRSEDPYGPLYTGYRSGAHLALCLVGDLVGIGALTKFGGRYLSADASSAGRPGGSFVWPLLLVHGVLFALYTGVVGSWLAYPLLWLLPLATLPQLINRVRTIVEHAGDAANRSTVPGCLEYLLVAPYGYSYHFEHHLAPGIPFYRLAEAHARLRERGFAFGSRELSEGYLRTFAKLARAIARLP